MALNSRKHCSLAILQKLLIFGVISIANCHHQKGHKHGFEPHLELTPGKESSQINIITYFMFNITNPDEFEAGDKPIFEEVGPYVYKETRRKYNVSKVSDSVLKYTVDRYWEFMPELSEGRDETDEFNIINIPMLILGSRLSAKKLPKAFNDILVEELTDNGDSLVRRNEQVGNIIYHGMNVSVYTEILSDILQGNIPFEFSNGLFALFKGKNGTEEGTFTIRSKGPKIGDILTFNNLTKLPYWSGDFCNKIDGTDGYFFRPGVTEKSTLKIFYPELCRSVYLKWMGNKKYEDIDVAKFTFPEDMLEDPAVRKENKCFCSKPIMPSNNSIDSCLKKGFIDYASCKQESPLLISYPHFLYADEEYRDKLIGLKPLKEKHESEFLVEPQTGTIVSGARRFQFNIKLRPLENVEFFRNSTFMIVPVFNTERKMLVPESAIQKLKEDLKKLASDNKELYSVHDDEPTDATNNNLSDRNGRSDDDSEPEPIAETEATKPKGKSSSRKTTNSANNVYYSNLSILISSFFVISFALTM